MSHLRDIRSRAAQADAKISDAKTKNEALDATITAAELYMQALKLTKDPSEKRDFDVKCKQRLDHAEKIKVSDSFRDNTSLSANFAEKSTASIARKHTTKRQLTTREKIILLEGSKVHGFTFPPWDRPPEGKEFMLAEGEDPYVDSPALKLSQLQLKHFEGWKRPTEALTKVESLTGRDGKSIAATMQRERKTDLVQDITSDCSVVASLCAGTARVERGHSKIIQSRIFPYNHDDNCPALSPNGKYILRLRFNGCDRKVIIDDLLPTSSTSRVLHVVDRLNPNLLWPALVEKAYLKTRGGYDFPGSNSGTDLAILTGWIPEQMFLQNDDILPDTLWKRISNGFKFGDVLLTIGTGKLTRKEERQLGLVREHDYAILYLREIGGIREMLIKNPWSDGSIWKGRSRSSVNLTQSTESPSDHTPTTETQNTSLVPGTFWMDFDSVFQHFENLYLNWNPNLFTHCEEIHFSWNILASASASGCFVSNPQFALSAPSKGTVWLLLNRHFQNETGIDLNESTKAGYISLYLFTASGKRVFLSDGAKERGPYVDSPNTLLKVETPANTVHTVVVASQMLSARKHNFTLSAFARSPICLAEAEAKYLSNAARFAAWSINTAGGNSDFKTYVDNPQFSLVLPSDASVAILLDVSKDHPDPPAVHAKIFFAPIKQRITRVRPRDILASTGDYRRQSTVLETHLEEGTYTVICSTFEPSQLAPFSITVHATTREVQLLPLPPEGAGRLSIKSGRGTMKSGSERLSALITTLRVTKAKFILRQIPAKAAGPHPAGVATYRQNALKLLLEQGRGPYSTVIASSHEEVDCDLAVNDIPRIDDIDIRPEMTRVDGVDGLWLVVEKSPGGSSASQIEDCFEVEALCEERISIGRWEVSEN